MRFEVGSAYVVGTLLPVLETLRRGLFYWRVEATTMLEDYVAGALLVVAAVSVTRSRAVGAPFLLVAWAYVTGMMSSSVWGQLEETLRGVDLEPHNGAVLMFKCLLWATCLVSLVRAFVRVRGVGAAE